MPNSSEKDDEPTHGETAEWIEWYRLTPPERWRESEKLWDFYQQIGGALDTEPAPQSPFGIEPKRRSILVDRRSGVLYGAAEFSRDTEIGFH